MNIRILVGRPKKMGIPETMGCRILTFMRSLGPQVTGRPVACNLFGATSSRYWAALGMVACCFVLLGYPGEL